MLHELKNDIKYLIILTSLEQRMIAPFRGWKHCQAHSFDHKSYHSNI